MNRKTQFIFRLKCIIKKCREKGLFSIAIKLKENMTEGMMKEILEDWMSWKYDIQK